MKLCGHTMGTPRMDLFQALAFLPTIGCAGIEVRVAANGQINPDTADAAFLARARAAADAAGIAFACLTPYYKNFVHPDVRERELAGFRKAIHLAAQLDCPLVRAYGGVAPPPPGVEWAAAFDTTAAALRSLADEAAAVNVTLAIETHGGTMTLTAAQAAAMVQAVDRPNVGILFDYVWIKLAAAETLAEAVRISAPWIRHVHVKDCVIEPPENRPVARLMGAGTVEIPALLKELQAIGYDGYLCDEYEKFWQPELPEPEIGMRHNADYLRRTLAHLPSHPLG